MDDETIRRLQSLIGKKDRVLNENFNFKKDYGFEVNLGFRFFFSMSYELCGFHLGKRHAGVKNIDKHQHIMHLETIFLN